MDLSCFIYLAEYSENLIVTWIETEITSDNRDCF
jgi:hypothetical protein